MNNKLKLKILFTLTSAKSMTGQQRFVFEAARAMRRKGHEVTILTFSENTRPEMLDLIRKENIKVETVPYGGALKGRIRQFTLYPRRIRELAPDIIFTYTSILSNSAVLSGIPAINYYWGNVTVFSEFLKNPARWIDNYISGFPTVFLAKRNICCSEYMERQLNAIYFRKSDGLIYCGIDIGRVKPSKREGENFRKKYGIPKKTLLLGTIGRFVPYKNHKYLLEYALLDPEATVAIAGGGELEKEYIDFIEKNSLGKRALILKNLPEPDLNGFFNSLDIYLHPSSWEGFGIPPLEASACGKISVTLNSAALPEVTAKEPAGFLSDGKEGFLRSIGKAKRATGKRGLARKAREFAKKFSWEKIAREVEREILAVARKRSR